MSQSPITLEPRDQVRAHVLDTLQTLKEAFGALAENQDARADQLLAAAEHSLASARRASAGLLGKSTS